MSEEHAFGELRSLLSKRPSTKDFDAVIDLIEANLPSLGEQAFGDRWLPYLQAQLASWPDETRRCEGERLKRLEKEPTPWASLVRTLEYAESKITDARCATLCAAEHLRAITNLDLRDASTSWSVLHDLSASAPFTLRAFALRKSTSSGASPRDLEPLFGSPMLSKLERLELTGWSRFGSSSMTCMVETLPLGSLRHLDLDGTRIGKGGLKKLFEATDMSALEVLVLDGVEFGVASHTLFAKASHLSSLRELSLVGCDVHPAKMGDALPEHWTGLERIDLERCALDDDDVAALCAPEAYPNLRSLGLGHTKITPGAQRVLFGAACFGQVEALGLQGLALDAAALDGGWDWGGLSRLDMSGWVVSESSLAAIAETTAWAGVRELRALELVHPDDHENLLRGSYAPFDTRVQNDRSVSLTLVSAELPSALESLTLGKNRVDGAHLGVLLDRGYARTLEVLAIGDQVAELDAAGLEQLADAERLPALRELRGKWAEEHADALERIARELPSFERLVFEGWRGWRGQRVMRERVEGVEFV